MTYRVVVPACQPLLPAGQVRQPHAIVNFISPAMDYEVGISALLQQLGEKISTELGNFIFLL
jgi:hypothetical protein